MLLLTQLHSQRSCDNVWWDSKLRSIVEIKDDQEFLDSLKANLPYAEDCQNWRGVVGILNGFTFYYYGTGDLDSAYFYSSKSHEVVEREIDQLGDTSFFAINAFNDLGAIQYYFLGDIDRRIDLLERAAKGIEKLARIEEKPYWLDHYLQITFHNLAATYAQLGDFDEAIRVYRRVIILKEQLPDPEPLYIAPSYAELGKVYMEMGDLQEAHSWYQKALNTIPQTDASVPGYLHQLAKIDLEQKNTKQALANIQLAQTLSSDGAGVETNYLLGKVSLSDNQQNQALVFFEKALNEALDQPAGNHALIAELYGLLADCWLKKGDYKASLHAVNTGLAYLANEEEPIDKLLYYPEKEAIHFPFEAVELLQRQADFIEEIAGKTDLFSNLDIQEHKSKLNELALELCQEQIASFRADDSKLFWVDKMSALVHQQVSLQADIFQSTRNALALEKALEAAEILKAAVLREAISDARALSQSSVPQSFSERLGALKFERVKLERKLAASPDDSTLQKQLFAAERSLELANDSVFDLLKNSSLGSGLYQHPGVSAIQQALDPNSQLIQFSWSDEQLVIFSIHAEKAELYTVDSVVAIRKAIEVFVNQLQNPKNNSSGELAMSGQTLFAKLLKPLGQLKRRLVIIPDGPLFQIPFAALIDGEPIGQKITDWPWLMKNHSISYSSSSSLFLQKVDEKKTYSGNWLGVAPVRFGNGLSSLPLSEKELERVGEVMGENSVLLEGPSASKTAFLHATDQDFSLLHFSTHASSNGNFPGDSWLAFAGDGDSARLFLDELYALPLKAQLVVLSACETQSGKLSKGEGIMSLARAFRYAGSESVLATLWPSDELASSFVMEQFYLALSEGLPKDEALQQAQLHYLLEAGLPDDKMHPAYWAPFVLTGDMAPFETGTDFSWWWLLLLPVILGIGWVFLRR